MKFTPTSIPDVILVEPRVFGDARGFFMETYQALEFAENGISATFVQDNHSSSGQGILRGIHYQIEIHRGTAVFNVTKIQQRPAANNSHTHRSHGVQDGIFRD